MPEDLPTGAPCWIDLLTSEPRRSSEFYCALFGWTAGEASPEFGGYFMFFLDGAPIAGVMPNLPDMNIDDQWGTHLAVDDARGAVEKALTHGGHLGQEPMEIADLGTAAIVGDPGGARIGMWQANTFAGFGARGRPGAPGWFELHTRDYEDSVAFYRDVFGWETHTMSDTAQFRYTTLGSDANACAGIMDASAMLAPDAGAEWRIYFATADTDASLARVTELGGSIVRAAEDTPYGRLADVADPLGSRFMLIDPNRTS